MSERIIHQNGGGDNGAVLDTARGYICRVCGVENHVERSKRWEAVGECPLCGESRVLFRRLDDRVTTADILAALERVHGLPFVAFQQHVGGHAGTHTLARPEADEEVEIPPLLIVWNGRGRALGRWGGDFGKPDLEATRRLFEEARDAVRAGQHPSISLREEVTR